MDVLTESMKSALFKGRFICPECGSAEAERNVSKEAQQHGDRIRRHYTCAKCHFEIPIHLAERWGGISIEDAMNEWRELYRDQAKAQETHAKL